MTYIPFFSALVAAWSMVSNIYIFMISFALFGTKNGWFTTFDSVFFFDPVGEVVVVSAEIWHLRFSATIVFSSSSYQEKTCNLRFSVKQLYMILKFKLVSTNYMAS